jgi:energy-converting hydrogenase Eha subunit G
MPYGALENREIALDRVRMNRAVLKVHVLASLVVHAGAGGEHAAEALVMGGLVLRK